MGRIKIAIVGRRQLRELAGAGHRATTRDKQPDDAIGLMHWEIGGYRPQDIEVVAAFDVDVRKVGKDVSEAIFEPPNCTAVFCAELPEDRRAGADGPRARRRRRAHARLPRASAPSWSRTRRRPSHAEVVARCEQSGAEILVNYLPVGSEQAARFYAECALEAGVAVVNCIPVFIASDPVLARALRRARHPDRRRRHQGAARRHHHPPHAHRPVPRARREARAHLPAQHRRQHRLPEHAEPQPARLQEGLEDRGRAVGGGQPPRRREHPRRARATTWPGRTTTRSASCAWRGGSSATCR